MEIVTNVKIPENIWIAGKGPSLDTYNWSRANKYRFCINETIYIVPEPWAVFAIDYCVLDKFLEKPFPKEILVFRKHSHTKYVFPKMYLWTQEEVKIYFATVICAVQVLKGLGAKRIHFVGFDSIDNNLDFAKSVDNINAKGRSENYHKINELLLKVIKDLNLEAIWEHQL